MSEAIDKLSELLRPPNVWGVAAQAAKMRQYNDKMRMLAMGWPSLAAALAQLLDENEITVPDTLRRAKAMVEAKFIDEDS